MIHLRRFNEAVYGVDEVKEFCGNNLAYLLDDDTYQFSVTSQMSGYRVSPSYYFSLYKVGNGAYDIINWNDIKDQVIPFLHMLIREYSIEPAPVVEESVLTYNKNLQTQKHVYIDDNPRNRTIKFNRYLPEDYRSDFYYMDIRNVIKDQEVPGQFYQLQIQFY
jgi:hypothetical protein